MGVDSIVRVLSRKQATGVLLVCSWRKNGASTVEQKGKADNRNKKKYGRNRGDKHPRSTLRGFRKEPA